jgi:hypothetical protein
MIVGKGLEDVIRFCGHDGSETPFSEYEIMTYLLLHGYTCGYTIGKYQIDEDDFYGPQEIKIPGFKAGTYILTVETGSVWVAKRGGTHSIILNDGKIFDPSMDNKGKRLSEYTILKIEPIIPLENKHFDRKVIWDRIRKSEIVF